MANVIKTVLTYQLDGSNRDFNIPFEYLARKFVVVTLIGVDRKILTINTDYRFATRTTISLTKAWGPADGYMTIELRRVTSTTDRLVDFTDGSILRAYDLNVAQIQTMHVAEEARNLTTDTIGVNNDGHLDARGRRIVNLANAMDDRDVVPFGQLKTMNQNSWQARNETLQFRNEAETFRNQAEGFKNESSINATNTKQWRDEIKDFRDEAKRFKNTTDQYATSAGNSASAAHQSEVNAENSATVSANSAHLAEQQADRAKREADKLKNYNGLANTIDKIDGTNVYWKGNIHANGRFYMTTNGFDCGQYQQFFGGVTNRYSVMEWGDENGWLMYVQRREWTTAIGDNIQLVVNGQIITQGGAMTGQLKLQNGHVLQLESASDKAHYILSKDGNRNNWYIGRGSDNNNDCTFHSYVHGTTLTLKQDYAVVNKHFHVGQAVVATDGNIQGTKWGGKWLDAYLRDSFIAKSKAWTQVWSGRAGGGVSVTVSQDLRFRNIWIKCANNSWNFFRTGPDGIYFIASDGGWLRFQIHSNGLGFKNIADSHSVPNAIMVENE
uniref:Tail fiber protein n=1 Tax=Escherichia phage T7 TaxID=10760 RepID=Q8LTY0_BPT7|nr:tail fiber protein [Escherichia phage T7]